MNKKTIRILCWGILLCCIITATSCFLYQREMSNEVGWVYVAFGIISLFAYAQVERNIKRGMSLFGKQVGYVFVGVLSTCIGTGLITITFSTWEAIGSLCILVGVSLVLWGVIRYKENKDRLVRSQM